MFGGTICKTLASIAKVAFPKGNKEKEICKKKPIQNQSFCTHAYA